LTWLLHYWRRTFQLVTEQSFDEAKFQAHINQAMSAAQEYLDSIQEPVCIHLLEQFLHRLDVDFKAGFKLSTGLSMEILWNLYRPIPLADIDVLRYTVEIEKLGMRLDGLRWKVNSSIKDIGAAASTLLKAYKLVRLLPNAESLVKDLTAEITALEGRVPLEAKDSLPFFTAEFRTLKQIMDLRNIQSESVYELLQREVVVLSNTTTSLEMRHAVTPDGKGSLHTVDSIMCHGSDDGPWNGKLYVSILRKLQTASSVTLGSLKLLETELPVLGQNVTRLSAETIADPVIYLNQYLLQLILKIVAVHDPELRTDFETIFQKLSNKVVSDSMNLDLQDLTLKAIEVYAMLRHNIPENVMDIIRRHFTVATVAIVASNQDSARRLAFSGVAWVEFAIGCIKLYVPDKVFDPQLRSQTERESHEELRHLMVTQINTLIEFQKVFTGQQDSLRIQICKDQLQSLELLTQHAEKILYRPKHSEILQLQAEFSNILKAVLASTSLFQDTTLSTKSATWADEAQLIRENVNRLIDRLSSRFEAYQDMVYPAISFLRCLLLGFSLSRAYQPEKDSKAIVGLLNMTPFLGSYLKKTKNHESPPTKSLEYLEHASFVASIDGIEDIKLNDRELLFTCIHNFWEEWSKKLEADLKAEESKKSTFRFRGSLEDQEEIDEEELNELFPRYDENETQQQKHVTEHHRVRDVSIKVAEAHRAIFLEPKGADVILRDIIKSLGHKAALDFNDRVSVSPELNGQLITSALLGLEEQMNLLQNGNIPSMYNFYSDPNYPETRKLVGLAHSILERFRELQQVDEIGHMQPLADVVNSCEVLLELVNTEPLAKILPKVEQLHGFVFEWQFGGWASRVYLVPALYEALTDTIICWRRLELFTWSKLLDVESTKCQDDANSWWFIAYQAVIAVPLSLVDKEKELHEYVKSLVKDLELYFSTAIIGQFTTRIRLLRQLQKHLVLLSLDFPSLLIVQTTVQNFLLMYQRFEKVVLESIQNGRAPIEKNMKDVLLLASWKDTNINALRESARKSHQKLFRIVRKFRGILGQPVKPIIEQGLPEEDHKSYTIAGSNVDLPIVADEQAHLLCSDALPEWPEKNRRLFNSSKTIAIMQKATKFPEEAEAQRVVLESFISNVISSIADLRKETPPFLTEENKDQVKHLKARKRKLFADTLRELRQMGFKYNLGQDTLAKQDSVAVVLANTAPLPRDESLYGIEYNFHKVLDLAPRIRATIRNYSDDLTNAEVHRSVGHFEGILEVVLRQRHLTISTTKSMAALKVSLHHLKSMANADGTSTIRINKTVSDWERVLRWLVHLLAFALQLIQIHAKLGALDNNEVYSKVQSWHNRFQNILIRLKSLPDMPKAFVVSSFQELEADFATSIKQFEQQITEICQNRHDLAFILKQLLGWTATAAEGDDGEPTTCGLLTFGAEISRLCDTVLVAAEGYKTAFGNLNTTPEDSSWLIAHLSIVSAAIRDLHIDSIVNQVTRCFTILRGVELQQSNTRNAAACLIALVLPIVGQYFKICNRVTSHMTGLHELTVKMAFQLGKSFLQLSTQGFCTPQEKSDETTGESGKLESGTGLGDGEGAEDISKDIKSDEDLSELAQEASKEKQEEIEDEKDAVDMADEDLEGELGSVGGDQDDKESDGGDDAESEKDMDEEAGDVDDLDPTAVDEKMWDGGDDEAEKDQQGDNSKGQKKDEKVAADNTKPETAPTEEENGAIDDQPEADEDIGEEQEDVQFDDETTRQDQNVQESDALDLPDDMDLDLNDHESASSGSDDLDQISDIDPAEEIEQGEQQTDGEQEENKPLTDAGQDSPTTPEENVADDIQVDAQPDETEPDIPDDNQDDEIDKAEKPSENPMDIDTDNPAPSDVKSGTQDQQSDTKDIDDKFQDNANKQDDGGLGENATEQNRASGEQGSLSQQKDNTENQEERKQIEERSRSDPFRKLGDALEKWHRQQNEIHDADQVEDKQNGEPESSMREFQHLQNDDAQPDAQALGTATDNEVQPIDDSMAIDDEQDADPSPQILPRAEEQADDVVQMEVSEAEDEHENPTTENEDMRSGVKTRKGAYDKEAPPLIDDVASDNDDDTVQETSTQLSVTHISDGERSLRDFTECLQQWTNFQSKTHPLSLSLTSQLRLILTPSQATKLSGSYRTGKRLNIKRIIPYIASSYKRDKIWMRRSVPTKRSYQILLCVDDSKSMGESSSGHLALESLVMVSRALTLLEAGQIAIMGFGADVFMAHNFSESFASHEAGAKVLQRFSFQQDRTDISLLIRNTIDRFRIAKIQNSVRGSEDLWQLALILSDGLTPSSAHENIRRLLREAVEERIMVVFIIMDDTGKKKANSVLDLKEAKFIKDETGNSSVLIERYLDTFPFQYYLIVHNLEDLPSALAGLLRTWFAEVNS
jgi:midasin